MFRIFAKVEIMNHEFTFFESEKKDPQKLRHSLNVLSEEL